MEKEVKVAIMQVSRAWNEMLIEAIKKNTKAPLVINTEFGTVVVEQHKSPIVRMLQPEGEMSKFADALQELFELTWGSE